MRLSLTSAFAAVALPVLLSACAAPARQPAAAANDCTTARAATQAQAQAQPKVRTSAEIVEAFASAHPLSAADEPLRHPASLEDVDTILHLDQIDLFAGAAAFASKQPGPEALALHAQIELSHGEAQLLVAEVLGQSATSLTPITRMLRFRQASGLTSNEERTKLGELELAEREAREVETALRELAADHARNGADLARKLMATSPNGYRGYRLAADYHRLRGDWPAFEADLLALAKANPTSNGLLFLGALGVAAEGKTADAIKLLQTAVARDGKFVRAQAHLVLLQTSPDHAHAELTKLRIMNPRHQLVAFAGPFIEAANKAWAAEHRGPPRWGGGTSL